MCCSLHTFDLLGMIESETRCGPMAVRRRRSCLEDTAFADDARRYELLLVHFNHESRLSPNCDPLRMMRCHGLIGVRRA
jgi:hypothetical protein